MKVLSFPTKGNIGLKRKHYSWRIEVVSWGAVPAHVFVKSCGEGRGFQACGVMLIFLERIRGFCRRENGGRNKALPEGGRGAKRA